MSKIDYISFIVPDLSQSCDMIDGSSGNKYGDGDSFVTRDYSESDYTHVCISFLSQDKDDALSALTSGACGLVTRQSGNGIAVWAEFRIPDTDCEFKWKLNPSVPPCTLVITIKKR